MQPTSLGPNLTGADLSKDSLEAMNEAADELTPTTFIDTSAMDMQKLLYIAEADAVGSVPTPATVKGVVKSGVSALKGGQPTILMDKIGERIAFERTGTRLYDALILKYKAYQQSGAEIALSESSMKNGLPPESASQTLARIRSEELGHFQLLCNAMRGLGGDPTAMTPCANVVAVASQGLMQVVNDPRTTLAQCLNAMLTAELTDNAGWELLITLADQAGETDLAGEFLAALTDEQEHLETIKSWLTAIVAEKPEPALV